MASNTLYQNRVAVVTGASSGIGTAMALEIARRGAKVALVARRQERLDELKEQVEKAGGQATAVACDVADKASVAAAHARVQEQLGSVDILVNNAGYGRHILFKDHDVADIERMMQTNYMGTVYWLKEVLPGMLQRGSGRILNLSSFAGIVAQPDEAAYAASKFAVAGLSESMAYELEPHGIQVSCAYPVLVRTEMFTDEIMNRMPKSTHESFISPEDFVVRTLAGFDAAEKHIVVPGKFAWVHKLKVLFPTLIGRKVAQVKLAGLPDAPG